MFGADFKFLMQGGKKGQPKGTPGPGKAPGQPYSSKKSSGGNKKK